MRRRSICSGLSILTSAVERLRCNVFTSHDRLSTLRSSLGAICMRTLFPQKLLFSARGFCSHSTQLTHMRPECCHTLAHYARRRQTDKGKEICFVRAGCCFVRPGGENWWSINAVCCIAGKAYGDPFSQKLTLLFLFDARSALNSMCAQLICWPDDFIASMCQSEKKTEPLFQ